MTDTPNALLGMDRICPCCAAQPGERCISATGRTLKVTHDARMRSALDADPVRKWLAERRVVWTA